MNNQKAISLIFIVLFCIICNVKANCRNNYIYWEDLTKRQKEDALKTKIVYNDALQFYNGKLKIGDNKRTTDLIKALTYTSNTDVLATFYFYIFNQICIKADGALSEILVTYCQKVILKSPTYVINYFTRNQIVLKKYAQYLGYELYFKKEGSSEIEYNYSDFKRLLSKEIKNVGIYQKVLKQFYNEIEKNMKNMD